MKLESQHTSFGFRVQAFELMQVRSAEVSPLRGFRHWAVYA